MERSRGAGREGFTEAALLLRRSAAGPSGEAGLPAGMRPEAGLLYRRSDATRTLGFSGNLFEMTFLRGCHRELPVVVKREWTGGSARPFLGAGGVWARRLQDARGERISSTGELPAIHTGCWNERDDLFGWVGSGGVRFRLPLGAKVTPELRYTRRTAQRWLPSQNQVDCLLGIGF